MASKRTSEPEPPPQSAGSLVVSDPQSHELLLQYQDGQSEAATAIFDRYVERLIALPRSCIGPKLKRRGRANPRRRHLCPWASCYGR